MFSHKLPFALLLLLLLLAIVAISGCGQGNEPTFTSTDEVQRYLDENPEVREGMEKESAAAAQ